MFSTASAPAEPGPEPPSGYWHRRSAIAAQAAGAHEPPQPIVYTAAEDGTWAEVHRTLERAWRDHVAQSLQDAWHDLNLDANRVPQLAEVSERLEPISGFEYRAGPGLVDKETFFGALTQRRFLSTQYVRWEGSPLYTPEPDVIHEVVGHAHLLAVPALAQLHELAGGAMTRAELPRTRQFVADVFWFSGEFGVVREHGEWRAYGAGLVSSVGELDWFAGHARIDAVDVARMGTADYDISRYQTTLFGVDSLSHLLDVVGGFFATCDDDTVGALLL